MADTTNTPAYDESLNREFSDQFDIIYNNISSNQVPGIDEYEKSVFLTKAQEQIIKAYFEPGTNKLQAGFDGTYRREIDFSMIMGSYSVTGKNRFTEPIFDTRSNSKSIDMPGDALMLLNEVVTVTRNKSTDDINLVVLPIHFEEYNRMMNKPFHRPVKNQAWRVIAGESQFKADLVVGPSDVIKGYKVRYIKRPEPIILVDLANDGLSIQGNSSPSSCKLDPILHSEIIQRGAELAWASYKEPSLSNQLSLNSMSQTEIGVSTPSSDNRRQQQ